MSNKMKEQAIKTMAEHEFTCLVENRTIETWRCQKPGTSIYAFDIIITRFGIAVVGDIDAMTFLVGSSYGLPFLAGDSVSYYIHSKLDHQSRRTEFDEEAYYDVFKQFLATRIGECWEDIEERVIAHDRFMDTKLPDWASDEIEIEKRSMDEIDSLLSEICEIITEIETQDTKLFRDLEDEEDWKYPESTAEAHELLERYFDAEDVWEYSFQKTTDNLMHRLYMVNHAAKEIMKIKAAEADNA